MILDNFLDEMNKSVVIKSADKVYDTATGRYTVTQTEEITVPCAFYVGTSAKNLVSDQFKTEVDAVMIIDPNALDTYSIKDSDIVTIDSIRYQVIFADDIMFQGEVLVVGVKRK